MEKRKGYLHLKKVFVVLLLLALMLTGCGRKPAVGVCLRNTREDPLVSALEEDLRAAGYRVHLCTAANDQSRQNGQIAKLLEEGCDLLVVEPVMTAAAEDLLASAQKKDVPLLFLNHAPEESVLESWEKAFYIGSDLTRPGLLQAQLVQQLTDGGDRNGDGTVTCTVIAGPKDHMDAALWTRDCVGGFVCLEKNHGDWSQDSGRALCRRQLARFGEQIDVIFCNSDTLALGALEALQWEETKPYLIGIGSSADALERIRQGDMTGTVREDVASLSRCVTQTAEAILQKKTPPKLQLLDFITVTKEDLQ